MMPRRDYLRHFARDEEGNYIGTEKEEIWTESDLEEEFGKYRQAKQKTWVMRRCGQGVYMEEE